MNKTVLFFALLFPLTKLFAQQGEPQLKISHLTGNYYYS